MKTVIGYTKDSYKRSAPSATEFLSIEAAAKYLAERWPEHNADFYTKSIINDMNCDAIYFEDGSVILLGF